MARTKHGNEPKGGVNFKSGFFLVDGEVVEVQGEDAVYAKARDIDFPATTIFWTRAAVDEFLERERALAEPQP